MVLLIQAIVIPSVHKANTTDDHNHELKASVLIEYLWSGFLDQKGGEIK